MVDEQQFPIQKKLSFSIDTILDKSPQPLFLKIKHHHHHLLIDDHSSKTRNDEQHGNSDCSAISTSDDEEIEDEEEDEVESCSEDGIINQYNRHDIVHRKKKTRTVFSRTQIYQLETTFDRKRYLSSADRANLAQGLRLTEQQVKVRREKFSQTKYSFLLSCRFGFKIDEISTS